MSPYSGTNYKRLKVTRSDCSQSLYFSKHKNAGEEASAKPKGVEAGRRVMQDQLYFSLFPPHPPLAYSSLFSRIQRTREKTKKIDNCEESTRWSLLLISRWKSSLSVVRFCVDLWYHAVHISFSFSAVIKQFKLVRVFHNTLDYTVANIAHLNLKW